MSDGLEGVVAAETVLSEVDGEAGRLVIRGYPVSALSGHITAEQATHLLLDGFFDDLPDAAGLAAALGRARAEVFAEVAALDDHLGALSTIEGVRALMARLADGDDLAVALRLIAAPAVFTPAVSRRKSGLQPLAPDPTLGHAADVLRMIKRRATEAGLPSSTCCHFRATGVTAYLENGGTIRERPGDSRRTNHRARQSCTIVRTMRLRSTR